MKSGRSRSDHIHVSTTTNSPWPIQPTKIAETGRGLETRGRDRQRLSQVNEMVDLVFIVCELFGAGAALLIGITLLGIAMGKVRV